MSREWTIKSFKSGNSVALRVPAAAGIAQGEEWRLVENGADFRLERVARPKRKFNVGKIAGSVPGLQLIKPEDRVFDDDPRPWDDPAWPGWAAAER